MIAAKFNMLIPDQELQFDFARSGGPGGQNVNKVESKVILRWNVGSSIIFSAEEKERIRKKFVNRLNNNDEIVLQSDEERSQIQNKESVIERLNSLVSEAILVPKKRRATRPTYSAKLKRLETKKKHSTMKRMRSTGIIDV